MQLQVTSPKTNPENDPPPTPDRIGYLRAWQVLEIVPIARSTWLAGVAAGKFPQPKKIGRTTVWSRSSIDELCAAIERDELADYITANGNAQKSATSQRNGGAA